MRLATFNVSTAAFCGRIRQKNLSPMASLLFHGNPWVYGKQEYDIGDIHWYQIEVRMILNEPWEEKKNNDPLKSSRLGVTSGLRISKGIRLRRLSESMPSSSRWCQCFLCQMVDKNPSNAFMNHESSKLNLYEWRQVDFWSRCLFCYVDFSFLGTCRLGSTLPVGSASSCGLL